MVYGLLAAFRALAVWSGCIRRLVLVSVRAICPGGLVFVLGCFLFGIVGGCLSVMVSDDSVRVGGSSWAWSVALIR